MAEPASFRFFNPGAMYPGPSATRFGSTGHQIIGGGHKIAIFPDAESGAAAHFDLLSRNYIGMPLKAAIAKWSGGNSVPGYVDRVSRETGLSPDTLLTPDLLTNPDTAVRLAKAQAGWEAGKPYPLDDEAWRRAHARALLGGPPTPGPSADPEMPSLALPAKLAAAPLATGSTTPAPGAAPAMTPYTGPSPDDVSQSRRMAQLLMQQGASTEPVQHWTQALARVLQGGVGGMYQAQAKQGEQQGTQAMVQALSGGGQPNVGALVSNPWTRDFGMKLAQSQFAQNTPQAQAELQGAQLQNQIRQRELAKPADDGSKIIEANGQIFRVPRQGDAVPIGGMNSLQQAQQQAEARRAQVVAAGIDPNSPAAKAFIASGKMPREDQQPLTATDKKAILEADEMVLSTEGVIKNLDDAKALSKKAYTGPTAAARGYITSFTGSEGGRATEELRTLITQNALQQLKATFGAAPTEGERKILLEIQGAVDKEPSVREAIFERARQLAEKRLAFYRKRAEEMRGGDYFKAPKESKAAEPQPAKRLKYNPETGELE